MVQWLRPPGEVLRLGFLENPTQRVWVQFLVGELRCQQYCNKVNKEFKNGSEKKKKKDDPGQFCLEYENQNSLEKARVKVTDSSNLKKK